MGDLLSPHHLWERTHTLLDKSRIMPELCLGFVSIRLTSQLQSSSQIISVLQENRNGYTDATNREEQLVLDSNYRNYMYLGYSQFPRIWSIQV